MVWLLHSVPLYKQRTHSLQVTGLDEFRGWELALGSKSPLVGCTEATG